MSSVLKTIGSKIQGVFKPTELEDNSLVERVEELRRQTFAYYAENKEIQAEQLLKASEVVDSDEQSHKLSELALKAECQAEETEAQIKKARKDYLQTLLDLYR